MHKEEKMIDVDFWEYRRVIIHNILEANIKKKIDIYTNNIQLLQGVDIIYVDERCNNVFRMLKQHVLHNADERFYTPFEANNLFLLNEKTVLNKENLITYSFDISLDTQTVSYINKDRKGKLKDNQLKELADVICSKEAVGIFTNIEPYLDENYLFNPQPPKIIEDNIYSFFYKRNKVTYPSLISHMLSRTRTKKIVKRFHENPLNDEKMQVYYQVYANLLKMFIIKSKKITLKDKFLEYMDFQSNESYANFIGLYNIALNIFQNKNLKIFSKIQKGKKDILKATKNIACDIFHLYYYPRSMAFRINPHSDIAIPVMVSNDNGLNEVSKLMKLRGIAIDRISKVTYPYYDLREIKKLIGKENMVKYFSIGSSFGRREKMKELNVEELVFRLEKELQDIYC